MHKSPGYTLIELLAVLAILATTGAFALANLPHWIAIHQAETTMRALRTAINMARHTAVANSVDVIMCPAAGQECGARDAWHEGVLIFEDRNRDQQHGAADVRVTQVASFKHGRMFWRAFRSKRYLRFTSRGFTAWQNGHLLYCPANGDARLARQIVLNHAGRTYSSRDRNGDGIHEDVRGRALRCA